MSTFAAIDVGSYEISMKIFELSKRKGIRQIDHIRHGIDMGTDSFRTGKLSFEVVEELCSILKDYKKIMNSYRVQDYKAYGTSALRELRNTDIIIDQIKQKTGIDIEVITNSEQRFLDYKSVALQSEKFDRFIGKPTLIIDIGGASIQLSVFEKDKLTSTQNLSLGVLRLLDRMHTLGASLQNYRYLVGELCETQMNTFKKLYLNGIDVENLILIDDHISPLVVRNSKEYGINEVLSIDEIRKGLMTAYSMSKSEAIKNFGIQEDSVEHLHVSLTLLEKVLDVTGAKRMWTPGVTLCDGIVYEYAENMGFFKSPHDFESDILACTMQISKRYSGSKKREETLERIALNIFDTIRKTNGLTDRDRLLLQISTYLHDCGKYISMSNLADCSYSIIKNTEIIGISHKERVIIANVVRYNQLEFDYLNDFQDHEHVDIRDHMTIAKLTAILRLANGLDRSHKMKFRDVDIKIEQDNMIITVETDMDISLEKGLFGRRAEFFEEIYNLRPVIRQKRSF